MFKIILLQIFILLIFKNFNILAKFLDPKQYYHIKNNIIFLNNKFISFTLKFTYMY